jgi:hypothetical protein
MTPEPEAEIAQALSRREDVWLRAWAAVANTINGKAPDCTRYADICLAEFDKRFPESPIEGGSGR